MARAGTFCWCDLSAYRPDAAAAFYGSVLGWEIDTGPGYREARSAGAPVAALFEMPEKFQAMRMPSFWMSYIRVASAPETAERAQSLGARVEFEGEAEGGGRIALIRDPLGAGFTVIDGALPDGAHGLAGPGLRAGHALHVSDAQAVVPFYAGLFGWEAEAVGPGHLCLSADGWAVAELYEESAEERGGFEYWGIAFTTDDLDRAAARIEAGGGQVFARTDLAEGPALAAADPDGAAFFLVRPGGR